MGIGSRGMAQRAGGSGAAPITPISSSCSTAYDHRAIAASPFPQCRLKQRRRPGTLWEACGRWQIRCQGLQPALASCCCCWRCVYTCLQRPAPRKTAPGQRPPRPRRRPSLAAGAARLPPSRCSRRTARHCQGRASSTSAWGWTTELASLAAATAWGRASVSWRPRRRGATPTRAAFSTCRPTPVRCLPACLGARLLGWAPAFPGASHTHTHTHALTHPHAGTHVDGPGHFLAEAYAAPDGGVDRLDLRALNGGCAALCWRLAWAQASPCAGAEAAPAPAPAASARCQARRSCWTWRLPAPTSLRSCWRAWRCRAAWSALYSRLTTL